MNITAECRFCGQIHIVEAPDDATQAELEELSAWACPCEGARQWREKETCKSDTLVNIQGLFGKNYPEAQELLVAAVPKIVDGAYKKVMIDTGKRVKITMARQKNGSIKVEKHYSEVESLET